MPLPNELTLARALELIQSAGAQGMAMADFAARWRPPRARKLRLRLNGIGSFLTAMADRGYLVRSGRRDRTRVALTRAGREFLERWQAEFQATQDAESPPGTDAW